MGRRSTGVVVLLELPEVTPREHDDGTVIRSAGEFRSGKFAVLDEVDHPGEPLRVEDVALLLAADDRDFALAVACQQVVAARRAREWSALEELLGLVAGQAGTLDERCEALAGPALLRAARVSGALGWLGEAPDA